MGHIEYDDDEPLVVIERNEHSLGPFLVGLAVGAGMALLFAPRSGEETRRDIGIRARRVRLAATDFADSVATTVTDQIDDARSRVEEGIADARQAIDLKRQQVSRAVAAGRVAAEEARGELERRIAETKAAYHTGLPASRTISHSDDETEV